MKGMLFTGPKKINIVEFDIPKPDKGEVLIKIKASTICGSDMHVYKGEKIPWSIDLNVIPGHEPCGVVEEIGEGIDNLIKGDRVLVYHFEGCGNCEYCLEGNYQNCKELKVYGGDRNGGNAEYMVAKARCCLKLPDELSFLDGSLLACNAGTSYETIKQLNISALHTVAVYGLGPVGIAVVMLAKAMGCSVIGVDILDEKVDMAYKFGADYAINSLKVDVVEEIKKFTRGKGADAVIECSGSPEAQRNSLNCIKPYGKIALVGVGFGDFTIKPLDQILLKQSMLMGIRMFNIGTYPEMIDFVVKHKIKLEKIISHRFNIEDAQEAFDLFSTGKTGKIAFTF